MQEARRELRAAAEEGGLAPVEGDAAERLRHHPARLQRHLPVPAPRRLEAAGLEELDADVLEAARHVHRHEAAVVELVGRARLVHETPRRHRRGGGCGGCGGLVALGAGGGLLLLALLAADGVGPSDAGDAAVDRAPHEELLEVDGDGGAEGGVVDAGREEHADPHVAVLLKRAGDGVDGARLGPPADSGPLLHRLRLANGGVFEVDLDRGRLDLVEEGGDLDGVLLELLPLLHRVQVPLPLLLLGGVSPAGPPRQHLPGPALLARVGPAPKPRRGLRLDRRAPADALG
mmetsp:Transcript_37128/g.77626  ORF Transcript_37128/g.77626 Transcript_37128/m.77626 type:complete len:289 (+) Transcript_37128:542-1408(+)